jgi:hypothetical protein
VRTFYLLQIHFTLIRYLFLLVLNVVNYVDKIKLGVPRYANVS